jgi:hypothetical protein
LDIFVYKQEKKVKNKKNIKKKSIKNKKIKQKNYFIQTVNA